MIPSFPAEHQQVLGGSLGRGITFLGEDHLRNTTVQRREKKQLGFSTGTTNSETPFAQKSTAIKYKMCHAYEKGGGCLSWQILGCRCFALKEVGVEKPKPKGRHFGPFWGQDKAGVVETW